MSRNTQSSSPRRGRIALMVLATVGLVGIGTAVQANRGGKRHDPEAMRAHMEKRIERVLDKVDATDAQRALVVAKAEAVFKGLHDARGDHKALRDEVLGQWNSDKPDADRLHALVDERIEAMRAAAHAAVDAGIEVHGAFNAEQRAALGELAAKRMGGFGGHHRGFGPPPGAMGPPDGDGPPCDGPPEGADKE